MKNLTIKALLVLSVPAFVFSLASVRWIPERCVVCGKQEGANHAEHLRTLSLIEWGFDSSIDLHWSCKDKYDGDKHSPMRKR